MKTTTPRQQSHLVRFRSPAAVGSSTHTVMLPRTDIEALLDAQRRDDHAPESAPTRWPAWRSRLPLACVLLAQAVLALRLSNTAFIDEAAYLYAGHRQLAEAFGNAVNHDDYGKYFSGAPFLYPVVAALADAIGGLAAARLLSVAFMLGATCFLYAATRRLLDLKAAIFAAGVFALSGPALFMSHLATFDAPAVLLLACGLWLAVRSAERRALILDLSVAAVAAIALKYASMVFVVPIMAVAVLVVVPMVGWRSALARGFVLATVIGVLAAAAALLAGPDVLEGLLITTTARPADQVPLTQIAQRSALYVGPVFAMACLGTLVYAGAGRSSAIRSGWVRLLLGGVLTASALIAPLASARLHTLTSLNKHAGYGLLLAAPMAGLLLSRLAGRSAVRTCLAGMLAAAIGVSGAVQARDMFADWPNSRQLVATLDRLITDGNQLILAEEAQLPRYYLRSRVNQTQWTDTYKLVYTDVTGKTLTRDAAYQAAVAERRFALVVLSFNATPQLSSQLVDVLQRSGYRQVADIPGAARSGVTHYQIWQHPRAGR
ncbi:MAG TPA: glycosyltransferase family 39 protein [Catenuloplanes sp.]